MQYTQLESLSGQDQGAAGMNVAMTKKKKEEELPPTTTPPKRIRMIFDTDEQIRMAVSERMQRDEAARHARRNH